MTYVDNGKYKYRRMIMCHMIADSTCELLLMARQIGIPLKWIQKPGTAREHFDICREKRALAISFGAIEISQRLMVKLLRERKVKNE